MDPLRIPPLGLNPLGALKPPAPPAQPAAGPSSGLPGIQSLAQDLFSRTLQAAAVFPVVESTGPANFLQDSASPLLAALTAPQASTPVTATPDAQVPAQTQPAALQPTATTPTAPAVPQETPATLEATAQTGEGLDFALQTALRFGAGVGPLAGPQVLTPDLAAGLIRDAAAVQRAQGLQTRAGGPGPEAFARPQEAVRRALQTYQTPPVAEGSASLDVLA